MPQPPGLLRLHRFDKLKTLITLVLGLALSSRASDIDSAAATLEAFKTSRLRDLSRPAHSHSSTSESRSTSHPSHAHRPGNDTSPITVDLADKVSLVLIQYHKTGSALSLSLARSAFGYPDCWTEVMGHEITRFTSPLDTHPCIRMPNPDLAVPFAALGRAVLHFVRDPYEIALSGYLYHSQSPPPEAWISNDRIKPCRVRQSAFSMGAKIGVSEEALRRVAELCRALYARARTYGEALERLPVAEGLRLEAARSLIGAGTGPEGGGRLLLMAKNVMLQKAAPNSICAFMGGFTSDRAAFERSAARLCEFVAGRALLRVAPLPNLTPAATCLRVALETSYIRRAAPDHKKAAFTHVTQDKISSAERDALKMTLQTDELFGRILDRVAEIVDRCGSE